jgi:hypothetical protein
VLMRVLCSALGNSSAYAGVHKPLQTRSMYLKGSYDRRFICS